MSGKLGCVVRMVVDSLLPMRNAGQKTIGKTHPRLVARFLFSRPRTNHIFCVLLIQFKNLTWCCMTLEHGGTVCIYWSDLKSLRSRFQDFIFSNFLDFRILDNLTLEISAFHPAFDPTLETLIHLTSLTPIPDCDVIMTSLRHIYIVWILLIRNEDFRCSKSDSIPTD